MHEACWAAHVSGRTRDLAAVQLHAVQAFLDGGFDGRDGASGVWNAVAGCVQGLAMADLLDEASLAVLRAPWLRVTGGALTAPPRGPPDDRCGPSSRHGETGPRASSARRCHASPVAPATSGPDRSVRVKFGCARPISSERRSGPPDPRRSRLFPRRCAQAFRPAADKEDGSLRGWTPAGKQEDHA